MNKQQAFNDGENRKADRFALIQKLGLEYSAEFVPFSKSRNAKEKDKSLNWRVTIKRGNQSLTTDYMQGIGHIKGFRQTYGKGLSVDEDAAITKSVEHGYVFSLRHAIGLAKNPAPELQEVLYSLIMDSSDAIDSPAFEEWANNYGYDKDSRTAEKTYRACLEIGLKLRAMIGDENLRKLRDLYQDY